MQDAKYTPPIELHGVQVNPYKVPTWFCRRVDQMLVEVFVYKKKEYDAIKCLEVSSW